MNKLKYLGYSIVFAEVPDEISLAIDISGCPHHCEGCHSQYLWKYDGNYVSDDIEKLIDKYDGMISCVCFMGGDQNIPELIELCKYVHSRNIKTCLYSGLDNIHDLLDVLKYLDYVKYGSYKKELGGLQSAATNQKMFNLLTLEEIHFPKSKRKEIE